MPYGRIAVKWSWVERSFQLSWVEWYSFIWVEWGHVLTTPDHRFGLQDAMPDGSIDQWVLSYDGQYITGWIMRLRWRVNRQLMSGRSVMVTLWLLTEIHEKSRNAAHTSAIILVVETNSRNELDHSRRLIAPRDESQHDMDRDLIWMNDQRWITEDGLQKMHHGRRMTINLVPFYEDI